MLGGEQDHRPGGRREPDEHRGADAGRVHDRAEVGGTGTGRVCDRVGRAVRATVAAVVPGDDEVTASEVRDLRLPDARVDDLPRRDEHDRRVALAVAPRTRPGPPSRSTMPSCPGSAPASARGWPTARSLGAADRAAVRSSTRSRSDRPRASGCQRRSRTPTLRRAERVGTIDSVTPSRISSSAPRNGRPISAATSSGVNGAEVAAAFASRVGRPRRAAATSRRACRGPPPRPPDRTSRRRSSPGGPGRSPDSMSASRKSQASSHRTQSGSGAPNIARWRSGAASFSASSTARMSCCFEPKW